MSSSCKKDRGLAWAIIIFLIFLIQYVLYSWTAKEVNNLREMIYYQNQYFNRQIHQHLKALRLETPMEHSSDRKALTTLEET